MRAAAGATSTGNPAASAPSRGLCPKIGARACTPVKVLTPVASSAVRIASELIPTRSVASRRVPCRRVPVPTRSVRPYAGPSARPSSRPSVRAFSPACLSVGARSGVRRWDRTVPRWKE